MSIFTATLFANNPEMRKAFEQVKAADVADEAASKASGHKDPTLKRIVEITNVGVPVVYGVFGLCVLAGLFMSGSKHP